MYVCMYKLTFIKHDIYIYIYIYIDDVVCSIYI